MNMEKEMNELLKRAENAAEQSCAAQNRVNAVFAPETNTNEGTYLNTVGTPLSQNAVERIGHILRYVWDEIDLDGFPRALMHMLRIYVKYAPEDAKIHPDTVTGSFAVDSMVGFVGSLLQLRDCLQDVIEDEGVWWWVDTPRGWEKPRDNKK